jgi:hypothetical protein
MTTRPITYDKKIVNFNLNTQFFDIKGKMGVVSHICIYKINNGSKNVYIFKPILLLVCHKGTDR